MEIISNETKQSKDEIKSLMQSKYPSKKLFLIDIPYHGYFVCRPQEMNDVKVSAKKVEDYVEKEISKLGGASVVENLPEDEKNKIIRNLDIQAGEISTDTTLMQCVIYPTDFAKKVEEGTVPCGIGPTLIQKITEISG